MKEFIFSPRAGFISHSPTFLSTFVFACVAAPVEGNLQALGTCGCQCQPCSVSTWIHGKAACVEC